MLLLKDLHLLQIQRRVIVFFSFSDLNPRTFANIALFSSLRSQFVCPSAGGMPSII